MWSCQDGRFVLGVKGHNDVVRCVTFSPDDKMFATGSDDGSVNVRETKSLGNYFLCRYFFIKKI